MIISIFRTIKDHRVTGRCLYPLSDLLTIALLTYLCGGEDYVDMSDFAESRARSYGLLKGCETSPSPDTFERLMRAVSPAEIERCLMQYGKQFLDTLVEKQVALYLAGYTSCTNRFAQVAILACICYPISVETIKQKVNGHPIGCPFTFVSPEGLARRSRSTEV